MAEAEEPLGTLGQETAKLLRAIASERMRMTQTAAEPASAGPAPSEHVCTTGWCPICQAVGFIHEHPELIEQVTESVTDAAVQIGRALREFLDKTIPPDAT